MFRASLFASAVAAISFALGCIPGVQDESSLSVLDVRDGTAVVEYHKEWSGFTVLPSSVWEYEPLTDKADRVKAARRHFDLQANGDYYAAEIALHGDSSKGSKIVGGRFSTGREVEITTRDASMEGRIDRAMVLSGERVIVRTDTGLLLFSLAAEKLEMALPVADKLVELLAAGGNFALATRDNVQSGDKVLIDLDSGEVREFSAAPDGWTPYFFDAVITDTRLVTGAYGADADGGAVRAAVLEYAVTADSWRVLAEYPAEAFSSFFPAGATVSGADETHVLISRIHTDATVALDLLDRRTGGASQLASHSALFGGIQAILRGDHVYWESYAADPRDASTYLNSLAIDTGVKTTWRINVPKGD